MKDIDKLKNLLTEFGVGFTVEKGNDEAEYIKCTEGDNKIDGYACFYAVFDFDRNGNFIEITLAE